MMFGGPPPADPKRRYRGVLQMAMGFVVLAVTRPLTVFSGLHWLPFPLILGGLALMVVGLARYLARGGPATPLDVLVRAGEKPGGEGADAADAKRDRQG